jgi:hypothetical protein
MVVDIMAMAIVLKVTKLTVGLVPKVKEKVLHDMTVVGDVPLLFIAS